MSQPEDGTDARPGTVALSARGLTKDFRGFRAVKGVDLDVVDGEVHALVGPNGAGKTTLFNLLTGFITPTPGTITVHGKDLTGVEERGQLALPAPPEVPQRSVG